MHKIKCSSTSSEWSVNQRKVKQIKRESLPSFSMMVTVNEERRVSFIFGSVGGGISMLEF